jgi:hypothetical protein
MFYMIEKIKQLLKPKRKNILSSKVNQSAKDVQSQVSANLKEFAYSMNTAPAAFDRTEIPLLELTLEPKSVDKWYQPEKKAKADVPFTFDGEK